MKVYCLTYHIQASEGEEARTETYLFKSWKNGEQSILNWLETKGMDHIIRYPADDTICVFQKIHIPAIRNVPAKTTLVRVVHLRPMEVQTGEIVL